MFEPIICPVFFTSLPTDLEITKSAATDFFSLYRHAPAILLTLGRVVPPPPPGAAGCRRVVSRLVGGIQEAIFEEKSSGFFQQKKVVLS